jgi:hypothetical protein
MPMHIQVNTSSYRAVCRRQAGIFQWQEKNINRKREATKSKGNAINSLMANESSTSYSRWLEVPASPFVVSFGLSSVSSERRVVLVVLASLGSESTNSKLSLKKFFSGKPSCQHQ